MVEENTVGCPNDGNKVAPGRWLCGECERDYLRRLRGLNRQLEALNSVAMKQARIGAPEHHPSNGFAPSPIDWDAQELMDEAIEWMKITLSGLKEQWVRIPSRQWRLMWNRITANRTTLLTLDTAPYDYMNLVRISDRIERRLTPPVEERLVGVCPECAKQCDETGEPIRQPIMGQPGQIYADCPRCGAELQLIAVRRDYLDAAARTELGEAASSGMHITRTNQGAADWLTETTGRRFTADQIRNWRRRRKLPSCKRVNDGYWEWSVSELLTCVGGV